MEPRSITRRAVVILLCGPLIMTFASCGTYSRAGKGADPTADDLDEGDRIRVRLLSGQTIEDTFVRATESELVCATQTIEFSSVERVEKWNSLIGLWLLLGGALVTSFFLALNQGMSSATWFE